MANNPRIEGGAPPSLIPPQGNAGASAGVEKKPTSEGATFVDATTTNFENDPTVQQRAKLLARLTDTPPSVPGLPDSENIYSPRDLQEAQQTLPVAAVVVAGVVSLKDAENAADFNSAKSVIDNYKATEQLSISEPEARNLFSNVVNAKGSQGVSDFYKIIGSPAGPGASDSQQKSAVNNFFATSPTVAIQKAMAEWIAMQEEAAEVQTKMYNENRRTSIELRDATSSQIIAQGEGQSDMDKYEGIMKMSSAIISGAINIAAGAGGVFGSRDDAEGNRVDGWLTENGVRTFQGLSSTVSGAFDAAISLKKAGWDIENAAYQAQINAILPDAKNASDAAVQAAQGAIGTSVDISAALALAQANKATTDAGARIWS